MDNAEDTGSPTIIDAEGSQSPTVINPNSEGGPTIIEPGGASAIGNLSIADPLSRLEQACRGLPSMDPSAADLGTTLASICRMVLEIRDSQKAMSEKVDLVLAGLKPPHSKPNIHTTKPMPFSPTSRETGELNTSLGTFSSPDSPHSPPIGSPDSVEGCSPTSLEGSHPPLTQTALGSTWLDCKKPPAQAVPEPPDVPTSSTDSQSPQATALKARRPPEPITVSLIVDPPKLISPSALGNGDVRNMSNSLFEMPQVPQVLAAAASEQSRRRNSSVWIDPDTERSSPRHKGSPGRSTSQVSSGKTEEDVDEEEGDGLECDPLVLESFAALNQEESAQARCYTGVILPDHNFKQMWNMVWLTLCLLESGLIMLTIAGGGTATPPTGYGLAFYLVTTCFFAVDMAVQSHTAFRTPSGILCDDNLPLIQRHYVCTLLPVDILCTFPFALCLLPAGPYGYYAACSVRLLRPLRATKLFVWSNSLVSMPSHMFLQRTLFYVLLSTHTLVCASMIVYRVLEPENSLIGQADSVARSYEIALYWMMTCLSTVGFGDIHPQRTETRLFSLVVMLFSIVMNLYILTAGLAPALQESFMNQSMNQKKGKLAAVLDFYKVPWTLRKQVYTVYPFVLESAMYDMQEIAELPKYLQDRIYYHIKLRLLTTVPLLRCASQACASTIATQMSRVLCPPGKFLVREGEMGDCMFFLVRGMVEVLCRELDGSERIHSTLKEGSWFGEVSLIKHIERTASVRSITPCQLFRLDQATFNKVLERFPEFASSLREGFESRTFKSSRSSEERRSRRSVAGHLIHEGLTDDNPFVPSFGSAPRLPGVGKWAAYSRRPDTPPSPISRKSSQLS